MRANGKMVVLMGMASWSMLTEIFMRGSGSTIWPMVKERIIIRMGLRMLETGRTINSRELVLKLGLTEPHIKEIIKMD